MDNQKTVLQSVAQSIEIPFYDLENQEIEEDAIKLIQGALAREHRVIPVRVEGNALYVAMENPLNFEAIDAIKAMSGMRVVPVLATSQAIQVALDHHYIDAE